MKAESSQATERRGVHMTGNPPSMPQRKPQKTIPDHLEVFQPSRNDTKRFMPRKAQVTVYDLLCLPFRLTIQDS